MLRNSVKLIGRATKEMKLETSQSGKKWIKNSVAINNGKNKNGEEIAPTFVNFSAFDGTAELMSKFVKKGDMIAIEGHLTSNTYEKDGQKHTSLDVIVDEVLFLEGKKGEQNSSSSSNPAPTQSAPAPTPTAEPEGDWRALFNQ